MKHEKNTRFSGMKVRFLRPAQLTVPLLVLLLLGGCNVLKRGDYFRQSDDSLYFSQIGFLMADNPGLSRDALAEINDFSQDIWITVPYSADTTQPLVINYNVVGKDTVVEYEDPPGTWIPAVSGIDSFKFNDGTGPLTVDLRISKTNGVSGDSGSRDFTIHVDKIIRPALVNPPGEGVAGPFTIATGNPFIISFVDEDGNPISNMDTGWNIDQMYFQWDDWRLKITNLYDPATWAILEPPYTSGPPEGYQLDVKPIYPGEHHIQVLEGLFSDSNGYISEYTELIFEYSPPPVYLSQSGNDTNSGLIPSEPVKTWTKARSVAEEIGIFDIYIEASETPYDVDGNGLIDGAIHPLNVFGNWEPGFKDRYVAGRDERIPTILTDLSQTDGGNTYTPTAVLSYTDMSSDFILDGVSVQPLVSADYATALKIENSEIQVEDCQFFTPGGSSLSATAVTITDGGASSAPRFRNSDFIGKIGGSNQSTGIRIFNSYVELGECLILSGDIDDGTNGISTGIEATGSNLDIWWSYIISGILPDPVSDAVESKYSEAENYGIVADDTELNMDSSWIHAGSSNKISRGIVLTVPGGGGNSAWIHSSTIISGNTEKSTALDMDNSNPGSGLYLFNSVLLSGKSSAGNSIGINFSNMTDSQIMGNAIHVGSGTSGSYGIHYTTASGNGSDVRNNLVWSTESNQTLGIMSEVPFPANMNIKHNDFWNTGGAAELDLGNGPETIAYFHANTTYVTGNIGIPADVDILFDYDNGEIEKEDVGKIIGTVPIDVMYGGENLSGHPSPPPMSDRMGFQRTSFAGVGWSMGPYEYDEGSFPQIVYVSQAADGGDDGHPLGTLQAPFASLARAYEVTRTSTDPRTDTMEIRIAEGNYNLGSSFISFDTGPDIRILGGYNRNNWVRDPVSYTTEFSSDGTAVFLFNAPFNREFLLEGFTLKNTSTVNTTSVILFANGAGPEIRNNIILGGDYDDSSAIAINNSQPFLTDNTILAGDSGTGTTTALVISNGASPEIRNNTITGGTSDNSIGVEIDSSQALITDNIITSGTSSTESIAVYQINSNGTVLINNDISSGSGPLTKGLQIENSTNMSYKSNRISGGTSSGDSYAVFIPNSSSTDFYDNTIQGGSGTVTHGFFIQNPGYNLIEGNTVYGGNATNPTSRSYGFRLLNAEDTRIVNNVIHGGDAVQFVCGIDIDSGSNLTYLFSNTIFGGRSSNSDSAAIHTVNGSRPHLINNIIIAGSAVNTSKARGFWEQSGATPFRFLNNLLLSISGSGSVPYRQSSNTNMYTVGALESYLTGSGSAAANTQINMVENPSVYFNRFIPGHDFGEFSGENWQLTGGGSQNAVSWGLNLETDPDYSFNTDRDGKPRDSPWSIGAYEY